MIIFGTRGVTSTKTKSEFHCPTCSEQAAYKHKRVRRFFTLYFIPVIPLNKIGEYVECQRCRGTYKLEMLDYDPSKADEAFKAEFHYVMLRVMTLMMLADGVIDDGEVRTIREVYEKLTSTPLTDNDVMNEAREAGADGQGIDVYLDSIAGNLNDLGKEMVIRSAFLVAIADGEFQAEEQELLAAIGQSLGLTRAHLTGVLAELTDANPSPA